MRTDALNTGKNMSESKARASGIASLCALLLFGLSACRKQSGSPNVSEHSPPDLTRCTRIEVPCQPIIQAFSGIPFFDPNFLTPAETDRLQSMQRFIIDDKESIETLAHEVSSGWSPRGTSEKSAPPPIGKSTVSFACYRNGEHVASITMYGPRLIQTEHGYWFDYSKDLPDVWSMGPPVVRELSLRLRCGSNLLLLGDELARFCSSTGAYPLAIGWCEMLAVNRFARNRDDSEISEEEKEFRRRFKCPSAGDGKSHYAMNPNCKLDSPQDMVLLFETEGGWNQSGGPDRFTFNNHDPKGGCVLLKDGTLKFIRTKEELQQLRWK